MKPIACTLSSHDHAAQRTRWLELASAGFVARDETSDGPRLAFRHQLEQREAEVVVDVHGPATAWLRCTRCLRAFEA